MRRMNKPGPGRSKQPASSTNVNGPSEEILTLAEVAAYLRLSELEVLRLIDEQSLPTRRIGEQYRFLKAAVQRWLSVGTVKDPGKVAQLAVAGSWRSSCSRLLIRDEASSVVSS